MNSITSCSYKPFISRIVYLANEGIGGKIKLIKYLLCYQATKQPY